VSDQGSGSGNAGISGMAALARLTLTDFRNFEHLTLRTERAPVVLTGENGAGKTNLLESISLFAPGRGLRRVPLAECARHDGAGGWAVAGEFTNAGGRVRLGTGIVGGPAGIEYPRKCRIDGVPVPGPGAFQDHVQILWLTPAMDRLFSGPAGDRRRFVDRIAGILDPGHGRNAGRYDRAMAERNRLLALGGREESWLDGLEAQMAETGLALAAVRRAALERLAGFVAARDRRSAFPPARLRMTGSVDHALEAGPAVDAENWLRDELKAGRGRDRAAGRALTGPHRSDLRAEHGLTGADAADCSTGEQKALLVSITLAKARLAAWRQGGEAPILLLDEVTAHLDRRRRDALFEEVRMLGAQSWMTGTEAALFAPLAQAAQFITVAHGTALVT
jgi:DNA replication and repair protein RecF